MIFFNLRVLRLYDFNISDRLVIETFVKNVAEF